MLPSQFPHAPGVFHCARDFSPVADNPDDEWMFNSPYHQDFSNGSSAKVRVTPSTVQGIPDDEWMFNSPFHQDFSAVGKLGVETAAVTVQGITDFEEPYTSKVSSFPNQLVDIEDEGGTGRMFEPWKFSNLAGEKNGG